jgi:hypothetical protein
MSSLIGSLFLAGGNMNQLQCTTELEAVNSMLMTIGESPVNSLAVSQVSDVSIAIATLREVTRNFQVEGWEFNTEVMTLSPDVDGYINIPANALKIDSTDISLVYVRRGDKLYDKANNTFVFTSPVELEFVWFLTFEDMPEPARQYITIKASRRFQNRVMGSDAVYYFTKEDEQEAKNTFLEYENKSGNYNMLRDNIYMLSSIRRG